MIPVENSFYTLLDELYDMQQYLYKSNEEAIITIYINSYNKIQLILHDQLHVRIHIEHKYYPVDIEAGALNFNLGLLLVSNNVHTVMHLPILSSTVQYHIDTHTVKSSREARSLTRNMKVSIDEFITRFKQHNGGTMNIENSALMDPVIHRLSVNDWELLSSTSTSLRDCYLTMSRPRIDRVLADINNGFNTIIEMCLNNAEFTDIDTRKPYQDMTVCTFVDMSLREGASISIRSSNGSLRIAVNTMFVYTNKKLIETNTNKQDKYTIRHQHVFTTMKSEGNWYVSTAINDLLPDPGERIYRTLSMYERENMLDLLKQRNREAVLCVDTFMQTWKGADRYVQCSDHTGGGLASYTKTNATVLTIHGKRCVYVLPGSRKKYVKLGGQFVWLGGVKQLQH